MSRVSAIALVLLLAGCASTSPERDVEYQRIRADFEALERDPSLGRLAGVERVQARQALDALRAAERRDREVRAFVAERRVDIARAVAEAELAEAQLEELGRERDRILLEASRRDAEQARIEAEKLRLQALARAEEVERARRAVAVAEQESAQSYESAQLALAEAEQSRRLAEAQAREAELSRREAELASAAAESLRLQLQGATARSEDRGQVMTLSGEAFAPGQSRLRAEARDNLQRVVDFVQGYPGKRVVVEGHTDSTGSANLNQVLSQKRAEAMRQALIEEGVDAGRITAVGLGEDRPVAGNDSAEGRARNRRVEIVVLDAN